MVPWHRCLSLACSCNSGGGGAGDSALALLAIPRSLAQQWRWRRGGQRWLLAGATTRQQQVERLCLLTGATTSRWRAGQWCLPAGTTTSWRQVGQRCSLAGTRTFTVSVGDCNGAWALLLVALTVVTVGRQWFLGTIIGPHSRDKDSGGNGA
jgi:hypothetical protein